MKGLSSDTQHAHTNVAVGYVSLLAMSVWQRLILVSAMLFLLWWVVRWALGENA